MRTRLLHHVRSDMLLVGERFFRYYCGKIMRATRAEAQEKETWRPTRECLKCLRAMRNKHGDKFVLEKGLPLIGPLQGYAADRVNSKESR